MISNDTGHNNGVIRLVRGIGHSSVPRGAIHHAGHECVKTRRSGTTGDGGNLAPLARQSGHQHPPDPPSLILFLLRFVMILTASMDLINFF